MTNKLKPCPFCGGNNVGFNECKGLEDCSNFEECSNAGYYAVVCDANNGGCGSASGYRQTAEEAAAVWNRRTSGWVSVEDRLPKELETVVVHTKKGYTFNARLSNGEWFGECARMQGSDVTHWMPLPERPGGKERKGLEYEHKNRAIPR